jgi:hypothetical protein
LTDIAYSKKSFAGRMTRPCEQKWREYKLLRMLTLAEMVCRHDRRDVEDQHQYRQD